MLHVRATVSPDFVPAGADRLFEALEAVLEVWPSSRVGVKAGPMMSERGAFRATDETLRTSEYVYQRMANYKLSHMLLMRQNADLTGTPIEHMSGDGVVHHFRNIYRGTVILKVEINAQHGANSSLMQPVT